MELECRRPSMQQHLAQVRGETRGLSIASRLMVVILSARLAVSSGQTAQTQYFEVLQYRDPTQCERMECLSVRSDYCREHKPGYYLREKGCPDDQICTDCAYGNESNPTKCQCENPPFSIEVLYGQECNMGQVCQQGEGICFRPCGTYLHITFCEEQEHCRWNTTTLECERKPPLVPLVMWKTFTEGNAFAQATDILAQMNTQAASLFPQDFADFKTSASAYTLRGILLQDLIQLESMFLQLDENNDGLLSAQEYTRLPGTLSALDAAAMAQQNVQSGTSRRLSPEAFQRALDEFYHRGLQDATTSPGQQLVGAIATTTLTTSTASATLAQVTAAPVTIVRPEACGAMIPAKYYCSFDQSCKSDCRECGWKSAADTAFSQCVRPTAVTCHADGSQEFCPTDQACHPNGNCEECLDRPIVDHTAHTCLAVWWRDDPSTQWTNWVCRDRNKVGMPCRSDQDCIYGLKKCLGGVCQPLQPYNQNLTCESDWDCPHIGHYCPADPTGGENIYWIQYCRRQKNAGDTCSSDRECHPDTLCNDAEAPPRCRAWFSLDIGAEAKTDELCELGWRDKHSRCAPPAKSKQVGRSCDGDHHCLTTDATGRTGVCQCKAWWDKDDSKYCLPVTGDYDQHWKKRRDYIHFRIKNCGSFWTEDECLKVFASKLGGMRRDVQCEMQTLSGGPYLPPADCLISDPTRFPDYCR